LTSDAIDIDRPVVVARVKHVRIRELAEAARPQMLFDLMNEIDHQQRREQRAVAGLVAAKQHDPGNGADSAERR
jgi:hypothetical protein